MLSTEAEHLNSKFGRPGYVSFSEGRNNLTKATLTNSASQSSLEVYLHGAHITSWTNSDGEHIFLSDKAVFEKGKAIRGGIPICFPQFGPGPLQAHGFARNCVWEVVEVDVSTHPEPTVRIDLQLTDNKFTTDMWPHAFVARISISLSTKLSIGFSVTNKGDDELSFQLALHTYYTVSDIRNIAVLGLKDIVYIDKVKNGVRETETRQKIVIGEEVDRAYLGAKDQVRIVDTGRDRTTNLERDQLPDVVVWNPWAAKAAGMSDLGEDAYPKFVCVEVGCIDAPVKLAAGQQWKGTHTVQVSGSPSAL